MLDVIAQANPETIEAFVAANIQEPPLKATATEWAEMFQTSMNNIIPLGLHGDGAPFAANNENIPWSCYIGVWLLTHLPPGFCSQPFPRVQCCAGSLGIL